MLDKQSEYIRLIQEDPSIVQVTSYNGITIFHIAASNGRLQVMEAIHNIDPHMIDRLNKSNITPLMWASRYDQVDCVKWLLDHDVDVNIKGVSGLTALDHASKQEIMDMIKKK